MIIFRQIKRKNTQFIEIQHLLSNHFFSQNDPEERENLPQLGRKYIHVLLYDPKGPYIELKLALKSL